jgi:hypothetical protein
LIFLNEKFWEQNYNVFPIQNEKTKKNGQSWQKPGPIKNIPLLVQKFRLKDLFQIWQEPDK